MDLFHYRIQQTKDSTRGFLMLKTDSPMRWVCDVLEDGYREKKEHGKTRIDALTYQVHPIQFGRFYAQYKKDHQHKFAIALMDSEGFDRAGRHGNVRVHKGNVVDDTEGCPLVGNRVDYDSTTKNFCVVPSSSTPAYLRLYKALESLFDEETKAFTVPVRWIIVDQILV